MRAVLVTLLLFGCTKTSETDTSDADADTDADSDSDADADSDADSDSDTDADITASEVLDCATSLDGLPAFYQRYFGCIDGTIDGDDVTLHTLDLPPHKTYYYGAGSEMYTGFDTRGGDWHPNPNLLLEQDFSITIPGNPVPKGATITEATVDGVANTGGEYPGGFGIALDGVVMFSGFAAPGDDIDQERYTFDIYEGHPQNTGVYHYHSPSPGPMEALKGMGLSTSTTPGSGEIELYGIMCDGTVVLGCTELDGSAVNAGDLDAQGGHLGDIKDEKGTTYFTGRYHTHICTGVTHEYTPEVQYYKGCDGFAPR